MSDTEHYRISIHVERDGCTVVSCSGEIDLLSVPLLCGAIDAALATATTCWIDLRSVTFLDATAIRELLHAHHTATERAVRLLITPTEEPEVMRPFESFGLTELLPLTTRLPPPASRGRFARRADRAPDASGRVIGHRGR